MVYSIIYWAFLHPWVVEYHLMGSTLGKVSLYFLCVFSRIFASCPNFSYLVYLSCFYSLQALTSCLLILSCLPVLASCLLLIGSAGSCMLPVCSFLPSTLSLPALLFHGFASLLFFYLLSNLIYCFLSRLFYADILFCHLSFSLNRLLPCKILKFSVFWSLFVCIISADFFLVCTANKSPLFIWWYFYLFSSRYHIMKMVYFCP
jgi:hypothetical protein